MPQLNTTISPGLWRALVDYAERTHEPLAHLVSKALAEYLQVAHHTLYQVSTATALVLEIIHPSVHDRRINTWERDVRSDLHHDQDAYRDICN